MWQYDLGVVLVLVLVLIFVNSLWKEGKTQAAYNVLAWTVIISAVVHAGLGIKSYMDKSKSGEQKHQYLF
jgi:uncharacterized membrane protein YfhO